MNGTAFVGSVRRCVASVTTTATRTGAADVATYVELFQELEKLACFGDEAVEHLERIAGEYRAPAEGGSS